MKVEEGDVEIQTSEMKSCRIITFAISLDFFFILKFGFEKIRQMI